MPIATKPKTLRQAKADYKAHGPQLSAAEQKRLERGRELDRRAAAVRQQDVRKREAERKRKQQEDQEREEREKMGIGRATQLCGYSATQKRMKSGMEAFVGYRRLNQIEKWTSVVQPTESRKGTLLSAMKAQKASPDKLADLTEEWEDMLASGTQLARELSSENPPKSTTRRIREEMKSADKRNPEAILYSPGNNHTKSTPILTANFGSEKQRNIAPLASKIAPITMKSAPVAISHSNADKSAFDDIGLTEEELYEAFTDEGFAFDQLAKQNQSTMPPPESPLSSKAAPKIRNSPSFPKASSTSLCDLGLSTQILNEAFDDALEPTSPKSRSSSSSSFGLDGTTKSSWEAALLKLAEVEAA